MRRIIPTDDAVMKIFKKDPSAVLDYGFNWTDWLDSTTDETILESTWTVESGLTQGLDTEIEGVTTVWLSGGTLGEAYLVTNRIVTSAGRTEDRSFKIKIVNR